MNSVTVGLMTPAEQNQAVRDAAKLRQAEQVANRQINKIQKQCLQVATELNALGDARIAAGRILVASGEAKIAEADKNIAAARAQKAEAQAQRAEAQAQRAEAQAQRAEAQAQKAESLKRMAHARHVVLVDAVAQIIRGAYDKPAPYLPGSSDEALTHAKKIVDPILTQFEQANTLELGDVNPKERCAVFQPGTMKVVLEVFKSIKTSEFIKAPTMDLSVFKAQIPLDLLELLITQTKPVEVIFAENVKNTVLEAKALEIQRNSSKSFKIGYWINNEVVYTKSVSMAISTSTSTSFSTSPKQKEASSPESSPPKNNQVGKPLPVPPKALPRPPIRNLEAK